MSGIDSTYLYGNFNPSLNNFNTFGIDSNADFMSSASGLNNQALQNYQQNLLGNQTAFTGYPQLTQDKFEKSGAGTTAGLLALGAGGLTTAGLYKLGGDYVNPFKDGKFDDKFLKAVEKDHTVKIDELYKNAKQEALTAKNITYNENEINSLRKIAELGPNEARENGYRVSGNWTKEGAAAKVKEIDTILAGVSKEEISKAYLSEKGLEGTVSYMKELNQQRAIIDGMKDSESLVDVIKKNPKVFGIKATEEAKIAEEAEKIINAKGLGSNKASAQEAIKNLINTQQGHIDSVRGGLIETVKEHYSDATKSLKESAPPELQKAFRNFKLRKAGWAGLIAAGVGALIGYAFGGKS